MSKLKIILEASDQIPINPDGSVKLPGIQTLMDKFVNSGIQLTLRNYLAYLEGFYGDHKKDVKKGLAPEENIYHLMGQ